MSDQFVRQQSSYQAPLSLEQSFILEKFESYNPFFFYIQMKYWQLYWNV